MRLPYIHSDALQFHLMSPNNYVGGCQMLRKFLLCTVAGLCVSTAALAQKGPQPFVAAGFTSKLTPFAFDRYTPGTLRTQTPVALQAGFTVRLAPDVDGAGLVLALPEVESDGTSVAFPIGELRLRFTDNLPGWVSIGAGRIIGANRKESWIQTMSLGLPVGKKGYVELRHVTDEGASSMNVLSFGIKL